MAVVRQNAFNKPLAWALRSDEGFPSPSGAGRTRGDLLGSDGQGEQGLRASKDQDIVAGIKSFADEFVLHPV